MYCEQLFIGDENHWERIITKYSIHTHHTVCLGCCSIYDRCNIIRDFPSNNQFKPGTRTHAWDTLETRTHFGEGEEQSTDGSEQTKYSTTGPDKPPQINRCVTPLGNEGKLKPPTLEQNYGLLLRLRKYIKYMQNNSIDRERQKWEKCWREIKVRVM